MEQWSNGTRLAQIQAQPTSCMRANSDLPAELKQLECANPETEAQTATPTGQRAWREWFNQLEGRGLQRRVAGGLNG